MRLSLLLLSAKWLVIAAERREDHVQATERAGGPHGDAFDDAHFVDAASGHKRISKITIGPCQDQTALTYIKFDFVDWSQPHLHTFSEHGKILPGQLTSSLELKEGQTLMYLSVYVSKVKIGLTYKTRVVGMSISNGIATPLDCGVSDGKKAAYDWRPADADRAFLYFSGGQGDVVDNLIGHTIPVADYF